MKIKRNEKVVNHAKHDKQLIKTIIGKTIIVQTKDKITIGHHRNY